MIPGRAADLASLDAAWARAAAGAAQLAMVAGDPGMGRSTLVRHFADRTETSGTVLRGRCLPFDHRDTYGLLKALLYGLLGLAETAPPVEVRQALATLTAPFADRHDLASLLAHLLAVDSGNPQIARLSPGALRQAAFAAVGDVLLGLGEQRPVLVVCEDIQWIDPGSAEWLVDTCQRLSLDSGRQHLMLLCTASGDGFHLPLEGDRRAALRGGGALQATELDLAPLGPLPALEVAASHLGCKPATLPADVRTLVKKVLDRAAGNPAYIIEVLQSLIDQGTLARDGDGAWSLGGRAGSDSGDADIPRSIDAALAARLEALPDKLRQQLQFAAVIGPRFDSRLLGSVLGADIAEGMQELLRLRLLTSRGSQGMAFARDALRGMLYGQMADAGRRAVHRQVGEALEALLGADAPKFAADLAHHFEAAGERRKALTYVCLLADRARSAGIPSEAKRQYRAALDAYDALGFLDQEDGFPPRAELLLHLADALTFLGEIDQALAAINQAERHDRPTPASWRARGSIFEKRGEISQAQDAYTRALDLARRDALETARCKSALADTFRRMGRFQDAMRMGGEALALFEDQGRPAEKAAVHGILGICHSRCDDADAALHHHQEALRLRQQAGDLGGVASSHNNLGIVLGSLGRFADAEAEYSRALAMFRKTGNRRFVAMTLNNLGDLCLKRDDDRKAEAYLLEAQNVAQQIGQNTELINTMGNLAEVQLRRGNAAEAVRLLERCVALSLRLGERELLHELQAMRGRALRQAGQLSAARRAFEDAAELAEKAGNDPFAQQMRQLIRHDSMRELPRG